MSWQRVKLSEISNVIAGQSPESIFYNKDGIGKPFFQGKADFNDDFPSVRYYTSKVTKTANINDILLSVRAPVGPTNICTIDACIGRGLAAIRVGEHLYYKFLYHYFKSIERKLSASGNGSTFSAITTNDVKNILVPLPPLAIQKQIAEILDKADALRKKDVELLKHYDALAQSLFINMFGDPVRNEKGWEVKRIKELLE
ncbi:MAG: restriction endonuclease subunit S, partial [Flavobacteriales bacterium]